MPMIDVYAATGTFGVPSISLSLDNTAAFVHDMPVDSLANANGDANYVRVQILTPVGVLNRDKRLGCVRR